MQHARQTSLFGACALFLLASCDHPKSADDLAVPITAETVKTGSQPVTISGLGQIRGLNTAEARAQTGGQILRIFYHEGDQVRAGDRLAQIDPRPLEATIAADEATRRRDMAALQGAKDNLDRNAPLVESGLTTPQQLEAYRVQVAQFAAAVAGDRAVVARDRMILAYATIRAPISGIAGIRKIDEGNVVSPSDAAGIVTIAQIQPIALLFSVSQGDLRALQSAIAKAGEERLPVDALTPGGAEVLDSGELTVVNNQVDPNSGTIQLKAVFPNPRRVLWPGQQILARVRLSEDATAVTIPNSAVQRSNRGTFVWIVQNGHARMQPVTLGFSEGDQVIVTTGLHGGEQIVTDGQFALKPGSAVTIAAAPTGGAKFRSDDPHRLGIKP